MKQDQFNCMIAGIMGCIAAGDFGIAKRFTEEAKTAFAAQADELAALRPLKPIAEAARPIENAYKHGTPSELAHAVTRLSIEIDALDAMSKTALD